MSTTRLGVGGPMHPYGTFDAKAEQAVQVTRYGVGGPMHPYGTFLDKAEEEADVSDDSFTVRSMPTVFPTSTL